MPKGIVHTQYPTVVTLLAHLMEGGIQRDERLLLTTPLSHAAGIFTLSSLLRGGYTRIESSFDSERMLDVMDADRITWTFAVPTMIYRLLDVVERRGHVPPTLRTLQYGAAPISAVGLRRAVDRFGPVLQQLFGQTECPNFAIVLRKKDHIRALEEPQLLRSCGKASILCDVSIRALDDGHEIPRGEIGELCLRWAYTLERYWDDPEKYEKRFHGEWLRTGDIAHQDDEGNVFLVDRLNDVIISGGMNVYSIEVEDMLTAHPDVVAAAVVGIPHTDSGRGGPRVRRRDSRPRPQRAQDICAGVTRRLQTAQESRVRRGASANALWQVDKKALRAPHWIGHERAIG